MRLSNTRGRETWRAACCGGAAFANLWRALVGLRSPASLAPLRLRKRRERPPHSSQEPLEERVGLGRSAAVPVGIRRRFFL